MKGIRTNTPLQALVTLNDSAYFEAAVALAERMKTEGGAETLSQLQYGYALAACHAPDKKEMALLEDFYQQALTYYQRHPEEVKRLIKGRISENPELAALVNVANVILNLDEVIMKT